MRLSCVNSKKLKILFDIWAVASGQSDSSVYISNLSKTSVIQIRVALVNVQDSTSTLITLILLV
jgi:hypothetical protein